MKNKDKEIVLTDKGHYWILVGCKHHMAQYRKESDTFKVIGGAVFSSKYCELKSDIILRPTE